jgi:hypothetical protein
MKKTKHIKLILITAALASCNREMAPRQSMTDNPAIDNPVDSMYAGPADSTLVAGPLYNPGVYDNTFDPCCQEAYPQLWGYSFSPLGNYYVGPTGKTYYYPGNRYRKGFFWNGNRFIVRGGWGRASHSASS